MRSARKARRKRAVSIVGIVIGWRLGSRGVCGAAATNLADVAKRELERLLRALAERQVVHGDVYVRIVRDVLQVARAAVEAAAQAALGDASELGLGAPVRLRLVQAVL